jgi:dienelactone hydrolase
MSSRSVLGLLLALSMTLGCLPATMLSASPAPHESPRAHHAGIWNTTLTDPYASTIDVQVFYPAKAEGYNATPDPAGAPFPLLVFVHDRLITPPWEYYGSYGAYLAERGYVVAFPSVSAHEGAISAHAMMANTTLATVSHIVALNDTAGTLLRGMVDGRRVAVAGHGQGARVAMLAAWVDGGSIIDAVAALGLVDGAVGGAPRAAPLAGQIGMPLQVQGGSNDSIADRGDWSTAFGAKARGFASLLVITDANHVQYIDAPHPEDRAAQDGLGGINRTRQHELANRYLMAFLDFHLKGDAFAEARIYGAEARVDLTTHVLNIWQYGVLDESVEFTRPGQDATVRDGYIEFCATVANVGAFPLSARNVTFKLARVEGTGLVVVAGPANETAAALMPGAHAEVSWSVLITSYGDYKAFVNMGDPDHNTTNSRDVLGIKVRALEPPLISHTPPETAELGAPLAIVAGLTSPYGVTDAWVNFTDPDEVVWDVPMDRQGSTDTWSVALPPPLVVGEVSYAIHVVAGNNATNATMRYHIPVVDTTPPSIAHTPPAAFLRVREQVDINATITDVGQVKTVKLAYNEPGLGFHNVSCGRVGDTWFYPLSLGPNAGSIGYTWWAQDTWGNTATLGPFEMPVRDMGPPTIVPVAVGPVEMGTELPITANITDDAMVARAWVLYTPPGASLQLNATPVLQGPVWRLVLGPFTAAGELKLEWGAADINGNVATVGPVAVPIVDSRPPTVRDVTFGNAVVGLAPFVDATVTDAGGLASVTVRYTDVDGAHGEVAMADRGNGTWHASLPPQRSGGELAFHVIALDTSGNVADGGPQTMVVRDTSPPVITHARPAGVVQGSPLVLRAQATDDVGISRMVLGLKLSPMSAYQRIDMDEVSPGVWEHTVAGGDVDLPEISYYFEATDLAPSSNVARDPPNAPAPAYRLSVTAKVLTLHGTVRDRAGEPIKGAHVMLIGTELETTTGADGNYSISGILPGTHTVWVSAKGTREVRLDVALSVSAGDRAQDFTMLPEPVKGGGATDNYWYAGIGVMLLVAVVLVVLLVRLRGRWRR